MAVALSPIAVEESAQARQGREERLVRMASGLKVTATGPAAKLFTGWWRSWGLRLPHHPVNSFGKPIRVVGPHERMSVLKIMFISACCLLVGAACLGAFMSGPSFIFAAPIVALFGWFYLLPIGVFVAVIWALYGSHWASWRHRVVLMLCCAVVGAGSMLVIGARGPEPGWLRGYLVGGFLGGALGGYLVTILKREKAQPGAAPNGGPATQDDRSRVPEGPSSVS